MQIADKTLDMLLEPSWLSGLISVVSGLVLTIGVIVVFSFNNSPVQQQLIGWQSTQAPVAILPSVNDTVTTPNSLQNTWPLLGFWTVIGLVVYYVVEAFTKELGNAAEVRRELEYVHVKRDRLIENTVAHFALRVVAAVAWLLFISFFFKRVIPYSVTAAHASVSDIKSGPGILYAFLAFAMIVLSMHAHTVLARLVSGRLRLFSYR